MGPSRDDQELPDYHKLPEMRKPIIIADNQHVHLNCIRTAAREGRSWGTGTMGGMRCECVGGEMANSGAREQATKRLGNAGWGVRVGGARMGG